VSERRYGHLVKPKHVLKMVGTKLVRQHAGFWDERDVHGTEVHWHWLIQRWIIVADKLYAQESRGVFK
jgi:hypothetical protein